uniref:Uncharacterized protein n=1 Tax=Tanacetum cinerariifolium TaxID=118510 RepID=A0A6L2KSU9_TANCI|nr:hypothetical protein [Tanacetum cinerariifolium]
MDLLFDVALLEAAQLKKTLKKSKLETHKLHASGSGDGVGSQPKVPDEQEDKTTGTDEGTGTKPENDDEEEENEEGYVRTLDSFELNDDDEVYEELYKDVNVRLTDTKHEEQWKEDEEIMDAGRNDNNEVVSMMYVKVHHEEPSTETPPFLNIPVTLILETSFAARSTIPPTIPPITPLQ